MSEAVSTFAKKKYDGTLPLVLVPSRSCCSCFMVVPYGTYAVGQRCGEQIGILPPGFSCLPSWYKVAFLVPRQTTVYDCPVKNCPTSDNVMVQVDVTLMFSIEEPETFVYSLGAVKFDELLSAATEESIRALVREVAHDRAYELRGSRANHFLTGLNTKFKKFGVVFSDATITNVILPQELADTLEKVTAFESKEKEQQKKQEYNLKLINDRAELQLKELKAQNDRAMADEEARKKRAVIQQNQSEIEAQKQKQLAIIKAEEEAAVLKFNAEAELTNSKIQGEKDAAALVLRARGEAQAAKIKTDQEAQTEETRAKAELEAAESRAKALLVEAEAENKAADQLKEKRAFDLEVSRLEVMENLARNGKIVISGENGDRLIRSLVGSDGLEA